MNGTSACRFVDRLVNFRCSVKTPSFPLGREDPGIFWFNWGNYLGFGSIEFWYMLFCSSAFDSLLRYPRDNSIIFLLVLIFSLDCDLDVGLLYYVGCRGLLVGTVRPFVNTWSEFKSAWARLVFISWEFWTGGGTKGRPLVQTLRVAFHFFQNFRF